MKAEINESQLQHLCEQFEFDGAITHLGPTGNGHINDTFLVETQMNKKYILQRINHHIFKDPQKLMENIEKVCNHVKHKVEEVGGDVSREVLTLIPTKDKKYYVQDEVGYYWRAYVFITGALSYDVVPSNEIFYNCAKAFGLFQKRLADFNAEELYETIPYFHHTKNRFENFMKALENNQANRKDLVKEEIDFVLAHKSDTEVLLNLYEEGRVPLRVTHNDTKINNVMVDEVSKEGICVIDLDTVMPGLAAYDFGDCIRTGATSGEEDEVDLTKVNFMADRFEAFAKGFLEEVGESFGKDEIYSLLLGAKVMTLECGIRFLTDYLEGDHYFKIHRENHNLDRARTQFKLVQDMEAQWEQLEEIIKKFM